MRKQVTTTMATSQIAMTKISKHSNGRIRATLPRGISRAIDIYDRSDRHIRYAIRCAETGVALELSIGPDVDGSEMNVISPIVHDSGQVELELPVFQVEAWNLVDEQIDWPDEDDVDVDDDGSVTIRALIPEWEPVYEVDMFSASGGFPHGSTISMSGDAGQNIESHFPITLAEELGLTDPETRAEITFDCVDGRKVMIATPTEEERTDLRNSLAVHLAGANKRQARFNAGRVSAELDVRDVLEADSVPMRWLPNGEHLIGFVREDRGD